MLKLFSALFVAVLILFTALTWQGGALDTIQYWISLLPLR